MYSTTPIPDPNLDHVGFYVLFTLTGIIAMLIIWCIVGDSGIDAKKRIKYTTGVVGAWLALMAGPFYLSYIKLAPVPQNIPVTATRVGFGEKMGSGKYPTMNSQVMYNTPDGVVSFGMGNGQPWADTVILYKNQ